MGGTTAAGIGDGFNNLDSYPYPGGAGGTITISGSATVIAAGGLDVSGNNRPGADIGGGNSKYSGVDIYGAGGNITISGGTVIAAGKEVGIGSKATTGSTSITITQGTPVVFAAPIKEGSTSVTSAPLNGIAIAPDVSFDDDTGSSTITGETGTITLKAGFTVPTTATLTIPPGWELVIESGLTLTNNGRIVNNGTITQKPGGSYSGTAPVGNAVEVVEVEE